MELKVIDGLVEKYLNAETSLQEEERLKDYFTSGEVAPHLQEFVPLFSYYDLSKKESFTGQVNFKKGKKTVYAWVAAAASVVIAAGLFFQEPASVSEFGSYEDPELAMAKTVEALQMVSQLMNTGTEDLIYLDEFNKATNEITNNK